MWNVGGAAPAHPPRPTAAVDNGRGGFLGSGTNAPMFNSDFFKTESPVQSHERFQGRLAAALNIDQTSRVLSFSPDPTESRATISASNATDTVKNTVWKNGVWVNEESGSRMPSALDTLCC